MFRMCCLFILYIAVTVSINICLVKQPHHGSEISQTLQTAIENLSNAINMTSAISLETLSTLSFSSSSSTDCEIFNMTCTGLLTFADCPHALFVDEWAKKHMLPHLIFTNKSCDLPITHGVKMIPHFTETSKMLADIATREQWHDAVILDDGSFDKRQLADLINRLSDRFVATTVLHLTEDRQSITDTLYHLSYSHFRCMVVMATDKTIHELFSQALVMQMMGPKYFWLVLSDVLTFRTLQPLLVERTNVVIVRSSTIPGTWYTCDKNRPDDCILYNSTQLEAVWIQDAFVIFRTVLESFPDISIFRKSRFDCENSSLLLEGRKLMVSKMKEKVFHGSGGQFRFDHHGYMIDSGYDISSTCDSHGHWFKHVGTWSVDSGLSPQGQLFTNTFSSFKNATLLLGSQEAIPFVVKNVVNNRTFFTGFCIDILDELALRFDFHYVIVEPPDRIWGAPIDDQGNWNGIVGMVLRKELAFGIGPFTITSIRESVIDFTKPYMEEGIGIITRRPDGESQKMFKMFTPFAPIVWGCIVVAVVIVGFLLYLVNRYSPYAAHRQLLKSSGEPLLEMMSLKSSMWLIYGSYMEQGGDPHPNSISGRCILGFWWLFTILMASTYTANLAAFLTVTIAEKPINSLAELAGQTEIKPLVKYGSNLYSLFKDAEGGVYKDIWDNMQGFPVVKNNTEALRYVVSGTMAYMTDRSQLEYILLHDCETYSLADEIFNTAGLGFIVPENAAYLDAFNYNIMKMQEAGLIDKWKQKWWPSSDKCSGSDRTSAATVLGLDSLAGPFLIYAIVASVAFVCLLLEYALYTSKLNILCQKLKLFNSSDSQSSKT